MDHIIFCTLLISTPPVKVCHRFTVPPLPGALFTTSPTYAPREWSLLVRMATLHVAAGPPCASGRAPRSQAAAHPTRAAAAAGPPAPGASAALQAATFQRPLHLQRSPSVPSFSARRTAVWRPAARAAAGDGYTGPTQDSYAALQQLTACADRAELEARTAALRKRLCTPPPQAHATTLRARTHGRQGAAGALAAAGRLDEGVLEAALQQLQGAVHERKPNQPLPARPTLLTGTCTVLPVCCPSLGQPRAAAPPSQGRVHPPRHRLERAQRRARSRKRRGLSRWRASSARHCSASACPQRCACWTN